MTVSTVVGYMAIAIVLSARIAAGQPGVNAALSYDGFDDRVEVPDQLSLNLAGDFTLEAWIRLPPSQGNPLYTSPIVGKAIDNFNTTSNYWLNLNNADNRVLLLIGDAVGGSQFVYGTSNLGTNTWRHVAGVRSATALSVYVDGILEATIPRTLNQRTNNAPLRIGGVPSIAGELLFLQGLVDEVRVWSLARSAGEIQAAMQRSLTGSEPGLVGYWRTDEGAGQLVFDSSPFGNSGVRGTTVNTEATDPGWVSPGVPLTPSSSGGVVGQPVLSGAVIGSQVTLNWVPGAGAVPSSYALQVATDLAFTSLVFNQNIGVMTSASGAVPNGFAGWARVLANGAQNQAASNVFFIIAGGGCSGPPPPPGSLAVNIAGRTATVAWIGVAGASSYRVEADVNSSLNAFVADVGNVVTVSGQNLAPAVYRVRVYATSGCGVSAPASATFTIP